MLQSPRDEHFLWSAGFSLAQWEEGILYKIKKKTCSICSQVVFKGRVYLSITDAEFARWGYFHRRQVCLLFHIFLPLAGSQSENNIRRKSNCNSLQKWCNDCIPILFPLRQYWIPKVIGGRDLGYPALALLANKIPAMTPKLYPIIVFRSLNLHKYCTCCQAEIVMHNMDIVLFFCWSGYFLNGFMTELATILPSVYMCTH